MAYTTPSLKLFISLLFFSNLMLFTYACCHNSCSGHGICTLGTCTCSCYSQWTGADCSLRKCPSGNQWSGDASATDTIHSTAVECSNAGSCDTSTGTCTCQDGFAGIACERMTCPSNCNNNGRCISLFEAATLQDDRNFHRSVSYTAWDANRIYGCACDVGYTGFDCSLRMCEYGDDPATTASTNDEVQVVDCTCAATCSGSFYLTFRGETTDAIPHDASATVVKARLEGLRTINQVTVAFTGGTTVCDADGVSSAITFTHDSGDVPNLIISTGSLASTGVAPTLALFHSGQTSGEGVLSVTGDKEYAECNNRGVCDSSTGLCTCYTGFSSSDGAGSAGTLGDCGDMSAVSACPGATSCSGHGTCSGATDYVCTCYEGWEGGDCSKRQCPTGNAWFAEPGESLPGHVSISNGATAVTTTTDLRTYINRGDTIYIAGTSATVSTSTSDTFDGSTLTLSSAFGGATVAYAKAVRNPGIVHIAKVTCSGRGTCSSSTGACTCMSGFEGAACERLSCPDSCSSHGTCESLARLAALTEVNGVVMGYAYGQTVGDDTTWDAEKIHGCRCDQSLYRGGMYDFYGHNCDVRTCPGGDDPSTTGVHEEQLVTCDATAGTFTLTFREETTSTIAYDATTATVEAALENLDTIGSVTVTFSTGIAACASGGIGVTVTFLSELGDLPLLVADASSLTGGGATATVAESVAGTKENAECSLRGLCDTSTGACKCFAGYVSGDGSGNAGTRSDCSYRDALYTG